MLSIGRAALGEVGLDGEAVEAVKVGPDLVRPRLIGSGRSIG